MLGGVCACTPATLPAKVVLMREARLLLMCVATMWDAAWECGLETSTAAECLLNEST